MAQKNPAVWYRPIIPDIKNTLFPVLDSGGTYPDHNLYFVVFNGWDLEVSGGLLLSDIGTFFVECYGVRMRGDYLRMQAHPRKIRVPASAAITPSQAAALREALQTRDVAAATRAAVAVYGIGHLWPPD